MTDVRTAFLVFFVLVFAVAGLVACDERHRTPRTPRHHFDRDGGGPDDDAAAPAPSFTAAPGDVQL
jgi:hypothetical protein